MLRPSTPRVRPSPAPSRGLAARLRDEARSGRSRTTMARPTTIAPRYGWRRGRSDRSDGPPAGGGRVARRRPSLASEASRGSRRAYLDVGVGPMLSSAGSRPDPTPGGTRRTWRSVRESAADPVSDDRCSAGNASARRRGPTPTGPARSGTRPPKRPARPSSRPRSSPRSRPPRHARRRPKGRARAEYAAADRGESASSRPARRGIRLRPARPAAHRQGRRRDRGGRRGPLGADRPAARHRDRRRGPAARASARAVGFRRRPGRPTSAIDSSVLHGVATWRSGGRRTVTVRRAELEGGSPVADLPHRRRTWDRP